MSALFGRYARDAREHDVADALRDAPSPLAPLGKVAGELADEKGVPVRAVVDPPCIGGTVEHRFHLVDREPFDGDAFDVAVAP